MALGANIERFVNWIYWPQHLKFVYLHFEVDYSWNGDHLVKITTAPSISPLSSINLWSQRWRTHQITHPSTFVPKSMRLISFFFFFLLFSFLFFFLVKKSITVKSVWRTFIRVYTTTPKLLPTHQTINFHGGINSKAFCHHSIFFSFFFLLYFHFYALLFSTAPPPPPLLGGYIL